MANIKSIGGNPIVLGLDGLTDEVKATFGSTSVAAGALTGSNATESTWSRRATTGDGAATIESIKGNTIVQDGSLLSVNIEGVESVGFNQWDEVAEDGYISDTTGEDVGSNVAYLRSKDYIPVFPSMAYHFTCTTGNSGGKVYYYDADKAFLSFEGVNCNGTDKTIPANARYMRFWLNYHGSYNNDICINLSGSRNGEYEPYWRSERAIPAATYFPNGMLSAGAVRDELTETQAVKRVGSVDLGTLDWSAISSADRHIWRAEISNLPGGAAQVTEATYAANATIAGYTAMGYAPISTSDDGYFAIGEAAGGVRLVIIDTAYSTAEAFAASLNGKMMHYALATPTTTPIDPPLNMTYKVERGGTESVMVPTGEQTAPPVVDVAYGGTKDSIVADALAVIAAPDGPTATTNHAVNTYLTMGGKLYKVTTAIASGETITSGTNVTETTVMSELLALAN